MRRSESNSKWIDVSVPISPSTVVWPKTPPVQFSSHRSMSCGDRSNNTNLQINCHTATHIDAPSHFLNDHETIDQIPLESFIGETWVIDLTAFPQINVDALEKQWPKSGRDFTRVLFKTTNSEFWKKEPEKFHENYVAVQEDAAHWLATRGLKVIGIDYLSIQPFGAPPTVHQVLLGAEIALIEGLDLSKAQAGLYEMVCLPLKLIGAEAAPARVILRAIDEDSR